MKSISVKHLSYSYIKESEDVVNDVSFDVEEGTYVTIVGPNGSGKSTLARLLIGLLKKNGGDVFILDKELKKENINSIRKDVGIIFQNPDNQFIGATVEDDIAFGLENRQVGREEMRDIVKSFSEKVGMSSFLKKEPSNLSGGQKQRVAIAGVLALNPKILIMDEATSMLDPKGKVEILNLINEVRKENPSLTVVSITHDIEEAYLSDQVIVLKDGKVMVSGKPEDVFKDEKTLEENNLTVPFLYKVKNKMRELGYDTKKVKSLEEAVDVLCQ